MTDQLQILISTGFKIDRSVLDETISKLQNTKISLSVDINNSNLKNLATQIKQVNQEVGNANKNSGLTQSQKNAESFYNSVIEKTRQYKLGLMDLETYINKVQGQLYKNDGSYATQFNNLEYTKQLEVLNNINTAMKQQQAIAQETATINNKITSSKKAEDTEKQKQAYSQLNKLLTEEYNIRMRIEDAKLQRYQVASDSKTEQQRVTILEQELQKQLQINQAKKENITSTLTDNRLTNQEKLNQLIERESQLKSELVIKQNQIASAQKISSEKAEYDLKMFQQSMNLQSDSLSRRYSYVSGASAEIDKYKQSLQGITVENGKWYQSVRQADGSMQTQTVTAQQLRMQYRQMRNEIQSNITIFDRLRDNLGKFATFFTAGNFLMTGIRQIKEMFTYTNEMNKYLTNVQIITGETASQVSGLTKEYQKLGQQLAVTSQNIATVAEDFYRQGLDSSQITELTKATAQMATLAGMGMAEATENITSIKNGYNMSINEISKAVDSLVSIDMNAATSVEELSTALARSSNTAQSVGVDFDTLAGYIGVVSSTTRKSAETIGESMKSIFTRYSDIKLTTMFGGGWLEDGDSASNVEKTLEKIGISMRESETEFRSFSDVIDELSLKWKNLDGESQNAVAKAMAGTYQRENFLVLLNNLSEATKLTEDATNSAGLAQDRYGTYLESTEAKMNRLISTAQELYSSLLNSSFINFFIDGTTGVLSFINSLGGLPPLLMGISSAMMIIKNQSVSIMGINMIKGISSIGIQTSDLVTKLGLVGKSMNVASKHGASFSQQLTVASRAMDLMNLKARLLSVGLGVLVASISLLVIWQNKQKQAHEELMQTYSDEVSSNNDKLSSIESLKSQYEELSKIENKTVEDNKKIKSIQEELIKTLGLKKDAIDLLNGSWEENSKVIDENTKKLLERNLLNQNELVKEAQNEFDSTDNPTLFSSTGISKDKKAVQEIKSLYEELKADYGDLIRIDSEGTVLSFDREKMSVEDFSDALYDVKSRIQESYSYLYDSNAYDKFSTDIGNFTTKYENLDAQIKARYDSWSRLDSINIAEKLGIDDLSNLDATQIQDIKDSFADFVNAQGDVADTQYIDYFNDYVSSLANAETQTDGLTTSISNLAITSDGLENLAKSYEALSNTSDDLSSMIEKIKDAGGITQEVVNNIVGNYPELIKYLNDESKLREAIVEKMEETKKAQSSTLREMVGAEGSYYDEANALSEEYYRDKIVGNQETYTALQTELKQYYNSLGVAYDVDFDNYKNVDQLKAKVTEDLINNLSKAWSQYFSKLNAQFSEMSNITKQLSQQSSLTGNSWTNSAVSNILGGNDMSALAQEKLEEIKRKAQGVNAVADKEISDLTSKMNQLSNIFGKYTFDPVTVTAGDSSSKSSSGKSDADSIKDKYDKIIAQILSSTNEVERAIELSNQKIEMAELTGNTATANKEKENLVKLYDDRKKLIHEQANQLRELLKTVKDEEVRATISDNIVDLQDGYHDIQIASLEDRIELVKELHETTIESLNDEIDLLNQQRTLMNQDSNEYKDTYAKEYKLVLDQQLATIKAINDLKAQGYSEESDAIKELKTEWKGYESTRLDIIKSVAEINKQSQLDSLEAANDGLESLLDMTMDMVKQRYDDEKEMIQDLIDEREEAVQKEIDGYKSIIDAKKKMLQDEQNDREYLQDLEEKQQSIADKENRLEVLSKDDSDKAKAEYKKLYEELKNEKQELDNLQYDHSIETQENMLDEELQRYEDAKNEELEIFKSQKESEIKEIEEYASREANIREEAMKLIQSKSKKFYDQLIEYNNLYGDGVVETVVDSWSNGYAAMDKYNGGLYNVLETLQKISDEMEGINAAPLSQFVDTGSYNTSTSTVETAIKNQGSTTATTQNSELAKQQASQQKYLHNLMVDAQKSGNKQLVAWIESERLKWGMDKYGKITKQYHSGGFVGGLKHNEEFAKVLKGEFMVTDKMQDNFTQNVLPKIAGAKSTPSFTLNVDRFMDIDKLDNSTDLEKLSSKLVDNVFNKITSAYNLKFGR